MMFRIVLHALFVLIPAMFILPGLAGADDAESYGTEKVADGVYLFRSGAQRSLFLVGETGVIVTDPLNQAAAKAYRESISRVTKLPVKYVVYSHYHWDRVAGGQIFKEEGARFIAQERCTQRFRVNPNPAVVMPDVSFADRLDVSVGDMTLEMHYFGPSHGDCLTVYVPHIRPHNVRQFFGAVDNLVAERGVQEIVASRAGMLTDGTMITATGPVIAVRGQAAFWSSIFTVVDVANGQGQIGLDSFVHMEAIDLNLFKPYAGYEPNDLPLIMRRFVGYLAMGR